MLHTGGIRLSTPRFVLETIVETKNQYENTIKFEAIKPFFESK